MPEIWTVMDGRIPDLSGIAVSDGQRVKWKVIAAPTPAFPFEGHTSGIKLEYEVIDMNAGEKDLLKEELLAIKNEGPTAWATLKSLASTGDLSNPQAQEAIYKLIQNAEVMAKYNLEVGIFS